MKWMVWLLMVVGVVGLGVVVVQDVEIDEELVVVVKVYMVGYDQVMMDEVVCWLQVQVELVLFSENFQGEFVEWFIVIWLMYVFDQYICVDFKGDCLVLLWVICMVSGEMWVEFCVGCIFIQEEFCIWIKDIVLLICSLILGVLGIIGFVGDNCVVVSIEGNVDEVVWYVWVLLKIECVFGLKVELEYLQGRESNVFNVSGGVVLQNNNDYCIIGFVVLYKVINICGIIIVVYCLDVLIYGNYGSIQNNIKVIFLLMFQNVIFDGSYDVQWYIILVLYGVMQEVFGSLNSEYGKCLIMFMYVVLMEDLNLCFCGVVFGYSCGWVVLVMYVFEGICGVSIVCNLDWVWVEGSVLFCIGGDSGVVVFWQNFGFGIVKFGMWIGVGVGNCDRLMVMLFGCVFVLGFCGLQFMLYGSRVCLLLCGGGEYVFGMWCEYGLDDVMMWLNCRIFVLCGYYL